MPSRDSGDLARMLARKAEADETVLEKLLGDPEVPDEVLGFHAQQAVEKRMKSVLAARGVDFERTHNLAYLVELLGEVGLPDPTHVEGVVALTPWATGFRYEDASEAVLDRERVRTCVEGVRQWAQEAVSG